MRIVLLAGVLILSAGLSFGQLGKRAFEPTPDHPAIQYSKRPVRDPIADLNRKISEGTARLDFEKSASNPFVAGDSPGYLRSILKALDIPLESQIAVFTKTSLQSRIIKPQNPRTIFFNDSVVIGWVNGGFVEVAAQDPRQGVVFYMLDQAPAGRPQFKRNDVCLNCHVSYTSLDVPGMLIRSVYAASNGTAMYQHGSFIPDHRTPFEQRWGGWYVTSKLNGGRHLGNATITNPDQPDSMVTEATIHVDSLKGKFDTTAYLSPHSDIVALMVFEHQMHMMNLITRAGWEVRADPNTSHLSDMVDEFVDYLLFIDEAPFPGRIQGTSGFAEKFAAQGPRDSKGRSLRQFDLERRLMRYPCSYMIYTEAFENLPPKLKTAVYRRISDILSGVEKDKKYARLSRSDRQAVIEILRDTKKDFDQLISH